MSNTSFTLPSYLSQHIHSAAHLDLSALACTLRPTRRRLSSTCVALAFAVIAAVPTWAGCGSSEQDATAHVVLVDHTTTPLSLGALNELNGSYGANCIGRTGNWSAPIGSYAGMLDNSPLSVAQTNSTCVLTLTSVLIGNTKYVPASSVALTGSYSAAAVAYKAEGSSAIAFYGNLMLSDATYTSNFTISLMYSDDSAMASAGSAQAGFKYSSASATESSVPPTDYTATGSGVMVLTDTSKNISDVAGSIDLLDGAVPGQEYVTSAAPLGVTPSFDTIDTAYLAGTPLAISGPNPSILASTLGLVGASLANGNIQREVIIAHIDNGVRAYQVITLTVLAP